MPDVEPKLEMTRLGSYTIVRKLAKGGMAEIYLARSVGPEGFEKLVVLKRILPKYAENPRFVQLFLDEAKLAASLDHPHIVHVYDMGRVDGHYFFTMEYVHGQDVRSILRKASRSRHPLPIAIAVQIARTMAAALHHAHERKRQDGTSREIVHRDVSPSNILVSYDGAIKLADFGVAKAASSSVRTRTGALKGKVGYMSPEQARGMTIDRRSDIFSLGVVLWELLSMRRLFKTDNDLATIQAIINTAPPPLSDFRDDCPPELERIARCALEKDPATRYQSAQQLQRDLDELARELKLDQSSIALSHFMTELFDAEIAAWREAQSSGSTVTDFIVAHSSPANATPVSESDFSLEDPGEDEEEDEPEVDDEPSEPLAVPPRQPAELAPRAGSIAVPEAREPEVEDATDFGPPPSMEGVQPRPLASTVPRVKAPVIPTKIPRAPDTEREENPFDNATTRLRPNPLAKDEPNPFNEAPTSVAAPLFGEEAPTVQAPPEVIKRAFADGAETVQAAPAYTDPSKFPEVAYPTPAPPTRSDEMFGKHDLPTTPFAKTTTGTAQYPMTPSSTVQVTPQTPPVGVPSMPQGKSGKVGSGTERVAPLPMPPALPVVPLPSTQPQPSILGTAPSPDTTPGHAMPAGSMPPGTMQAPTPMPTGSMPPGTMPQPGSMQGDSMQPGSGGSMQGGSMQPGPQSDSMQGGSMQGGSMQPGSMQGGSMQPGMQGSSMQGSSMQGGSMQPGSMQPGSMQPGSMQPGSMQGGSMQGGSMQPGSMQPGMQGGSMQPGSMQPGMQGGSMQGGAMQPGMHPGGMQPSSMPGVSPYPMYAYPGIHDLDPSLIDLAPGRRRWFIIAGVAVGLAVLAIILALLLTGSPEEEPAEEDPQDEPAPKKSDAPAPEAPTQAVAKPATTKSSSTPDPKAQADAAKAEVRPSEPSAGSAVAVAPARSLPKITKQPPLRRRTRRR